MRDPQFKEELKQKIIKGQNPVPSLPKNLLRKKVPNDFKKALRWSFFIHTGSLFLFFAVTATLRFFGFETSYDSYLKKQNLTKSAIRVDMVALPKIKASDLSKVDLTKEVNPKLTEEKQESSKPEISTTAMVDRTQETKVEKSSADRLKKLQDSLRSEQKRKELMANLKKKSEESTGRPELAGNILSEGYSLTGDVAKDKDIYSGKVHAHVQQNWKVPGWMTASKLSAEILVKIAPNGRITSSRLLKSSGNNEFDLAALRAVEISDPFPPSPDSLKKQNLEEGLVCAFP